MKFNSGSIIILWINVISLSLSGKDVERSYTPVSSLEANPHNNALQQDGETIELMIKLYKDGKMSHFLSNLKQGIYYT